MTRDDLITRLLSLPELIEAEEQALLAASERVAERKYDREWHKAELLLAGSIDGRNQEQRDAQLVVMLQCQDTAVAFAEREVARCRVTLARRTNDYRSVRAVAALLASEARDE